MKVFISWSGERSRYIAAALRDWLPNVIQSLDPWMSDKDIDGGSRWLFALTGQLNDAMTGVLCVTPENQSNPWLVFEAGALSKTIGQTMVCPLLYDLEPAQMTGPLSQFQAKALDQANVFSMLNTLNASMPAGKLTLELLERAFNRCWPELEVKLNGVPDNDAAHKPKRKSDDMLEEILTIVRDEQRRGLQQRMTGSEGNAQHFYGDDDPKRSLGPSLAYRRTKLVKVILAHAGNYADAAQVFKDFGLTGDLLRDAIYTHRYLEEHEGLGNEGKYD